MDAEFLYIEVTFRYFQAMLKTIKAPLTKSLRKYMFRGLYLNFQQTLFR